MSLGYIVFVTDDQESEFYFVRYTGYFLESYKLGLTTYDRALLKRHHSDQLDTLVEQICQEDLIRFIVIDDMILVQVIQFLSFYGIKVFEYVYYVFQQLILFEDYSSLFANI